MLLEQAHRTQPIALLLSRESRAHHSAGRLPGGHEVLLVNGGGIDGGDGAYFANAGADLHVVGSVARLIPGHVGCIVIRPDRPRACSRDDRSAGGPNAD